MKNISQFKSSRFVYFSMGPEGPRNEPDANTLLQGLRLVADTPDDGLHTEGQIIESSKVEGVVDFKEAAETAIERAKIEAGHKGERLVARARRIMETSKYLSDNDKPKGEMTEEDATAIIGLNEKLEQDVWRQERIALNDMFPNSKIHTAKENMKVVDFLSHPSVARDLGIDQLFQLNGIYPNLDNATIKRGEHLIISSDKQSIRVVHLKERPADQPLMDVAQIKSDDTKDVATLSRRGLEKAIANKNGYQLIGDRVKFLSRKAQQEVTIGHMEQFKDHQALMVNGKMVVKGEDGEFHRVVKKNGVYALVKPRQTVVTGSRISTEVPQERLAQVMKSLRPQEGETVITDGNGLN